ncbi:hypothetical protein ACLB2K_029234 [Fragaria x ananassa]
MGLVFAIGWSDRNMDGGSWTSPSRMRGGVEEVEQQWVDKMVSPNLEEKRRLPRCWLTVVAKKQWLPGGGEACFVVEMVKLMPVVALALMSLVEQLEGRRGDGSGVDPGIHDLGLGWLLGVGLLWWTRVYFGPLLIM